MIKNSYRKRVYLWLLTGAGLILLMLIIGGITRLTGSGLSITQWNLVMGAVPPLNHADWLDAFELYKQFPEYKQLNAGMTLAQFKQIYLWEYLHRLLGRGIGLFFIGPFLWFVYKRAFSFRWLKKLTLLFLLGALQGVMGWIMVKSGLGEVPYVSHYRLALHLLLAFVLFGYCVWLALAVRYGPRGSSESVLTNRMRTRFKRWTLFIGGLLLVQVTWGAFTAGLDAGYIYNTFPMMNGEWLPRMAWVLDPLTANLLNNPGTVQWAHRVLGTLLGLATILFWIHVQFVSTRPSLNWKLTLLMIAIVVQYIVGVLTLIYRVPISLGVLHQALALVVWGIWILWYHKLTVNS